MFDQFKSVRINISKDLTKVNVIEALRPSDGARIIARRIVVDKKTPIRWEVMITDQYYRSVSVKWLSLKQQGKSAQPSYLTRELSGWAEAVGFVDWQQLPTGMKRAFLFVDGKVKKVFLLEYQPPDPTDYPLE